MKNLKTLKIKDSTFGSIPFIVVNINLTLLTG